MTGFHPTPDESLQLGARHSLAKHFRGTYSKKADVHAAPLGGSMRNSILVLGALLFAGGCATNPVPENYQGPTAMIADTMTPRSGTSVDFFILEKFNGKRVDNAVELTTQANAGNGFAMTPQVYERHVPAAEATFHIMGVTHYAAPILALTNTVYEVDGDIKFTPEPDHRYVVKGALTDKYSAVWIEDNATGKVMDHKVEINGSSAQGFFQK